MSPQKPENHWWLRSDEELLNVRMCDLGLRIPGSEVEKRLEVLYEELAAKNILFRPPYYLGDEWFTPEDLPVIAVPFYLAHPRLQELEQKMMLEVEGASRDECMRLLRHETGHTICHAYRLHKTKRFRKVFGHAPDEYDPERHRPRPYSRSFVHHLDNWYAQTHPEEDFAETFAVWLTPDSNWSEKYQGWRALNKLHYVEHTMERIRERPPLQKTLERPYAVQTLRRKLRTHYRQKKKAHEEDFDDFYDDDLRRLFHGDTQNPELEWAHRFLRRHRRALIYSVARWTGERKYTLNTFLQKLIARSTELRLRLHQSELNTVLQLSAFLSTIARNYRLTGKLKRFV